MIMPKNLVEFENRGELLLYEEAICDSFKIDDRTQRRKECVSIIVHVQNKQDAKKSIKDSKIDEGFGVRPTRSDLFVSDDNGSDD